ncbi:MAG: U32 family peptidase [Proteobacteria bacterium]|nr:U32 family peptidase [Pseudomonadota bacterium]MBU1714661.1 U32 family peptidase [Pseudomonadota bacterium]
MSTPLELLAPAGNAEIGRAAIDHGADAVYIGAPQFSARAQAGQTIAEIAKLIEYAHFFHTRVYVALNTILTDDEIPPALEIIHSLDACGADGLIIQDMGLLELNLPPIPLIASTQMHNVSPEKVKFLEEVGFQKVVLARELSIKEIAAIRARTSVELEAFVHGALCVSYSGQCYMSHFTCGRSANRGTCSQPCRHSYNLKDGDGKIIISDKHLMSLKDMNRLDAMAELIAAGVTSFKIEGRYKEIDYVKNITAAYRLALDRFIADHPTYHRAGSGTCAFTFRPDPKKTFNRGYTSYYLKSNREQPASWHTPKSMGELIGKIEVIGRDFFQIDNHDLQNGDGLCFLTKQETLIGCRVDQVEQGRIYPNNMQDLATGTTIFRNFDSAFSRALKQSTNCRTIAVEMEFSQDQEGIRLKITDEDGVTVTHGQEAIFETARDPSRARASIETQLARTGETPYRVTQITIHPEEPGFLPLSILNNLRRQALAMLTRERINQYRRRSGGITPNSVPYPEPELDYRANVANSLAEKFYARHGARIKEKAWELSAEPAAQLFGRTVMTTRYCLLNQMDACLKSSPDKGKKSFKPPLRIFDRGHTYRLEFNCRACQMQVIPED